MFLKRVITAAVFIPIFVFLILQGGLYFLGLVCGIITCGLIEFHRGAHKNKSRISIRDILLGLAIPVSVYFKGEDILPFAITAVIFIIFFWQLFKLETDGAQVNVTLALGGILYISYLFSYILILRGIPSLGAKLVITVLFVTWMGDTGAYAVGKLTGKHRFLSGYSPNKSIEGFLAAIAFSFLTIMIARFWLAISFKHFIILGILMGVGGQMGDFFESMLKRGMGVKDFGRILPGHGGILDRFDSLFFTVPIFFYYLKYIIGFERITG